MSDDPWVFLLDYLDTPVEVEQADIDDPARLKQRMIDAAIDRALRDHR